MWWDGSYDWSAGMEGYRLIGRTGREDEEEVLLSMSLTSWSA